MHVSEITCDLSEAFNCVNHELLLSKLNVYGIQNKSYLLDYRPVSVTYKCGFYEFSSNGLF